MKMVLPLRLDFSTHHDHPSAVAVAGLCLALRVRGHVVAAIENLLISDVARNRRLLRFRSIRMEGLGRLRPNLFEVAKLQFLEAVVG